VCNHGIEKEQGANAMSDACCRSGCGEPASVEPRYRKILWAALIANAAMFVVEIAAGLSADSVSLLADAIDFAGDAANYGLSLAVLSMGLPWRARAALLKGCSMAAFGLFVLGKTAWAALTGQPPDPFTMSAVALLALGVNVGVAVLLYAYRSGDANMRSVWLCSRNDALGNVAVMLAAGGVLGTGSAWPDLLVAAVMAVLALTAGIAVVRLAKREIASTFEPIAAETRSP
jgi:Co/Zn/Cd efflux system component